MMMSPRDTITRIPVPGLSIRHWDRELVLRRLKSEGMRRHFDPKCQMHCRIQCRSEKKGEKWQ
jgi:hypothetical protein